MALISVIHGPNLNLLGTREPELYGHQSLEDIDQALTDLAKELGHTVETFQSNHEGALVDQIQAARSGAQAILLNAAGFTHTSVAVRDAVAAVWQDLVVVEVHLTIPSGREAFRQNSLLAGTVHGRIEGFGGMSYLLALRAASELIARRGND